MQDLTNFDLSKYDNLNMRFGVTFLLLVGLTSLLSAQDLNIYFYDSTSKSFTLEDVRALTFSNDSLNVVNTNGVTHSWAFSFIDYYDYKKSKTSSIPRNMAINSLDLLIYPNPSPGLLNLQFAIPSMARGAIYQVMVYDHDGRTVLNQSYRSGNVKLEKRKLDLQELANGSYICEVRMNSYAIKQSFILSK